MGTGGSEDKGLAVWSAVLYRRAVVCSCVGFIKPQSAECASMWLSLRRAAEPSDSGRLRDIPLHRGS